MSRIPPDEAHFTQVNVFHTKPEDQQRLFDAMSAGADAMGRHEGCVSVSMHLSADGTRLISITEWKKQADFEAMRARSDLKTYFKEVGGIITAVDPAACRIAYRNQVSE
ncbi:putative quinol monooxygenase [Amycolatopsis decaplanina]|uniref:Antibiotic biosynthesis monooxygenase n=1 Tax=Amycolatopsis decaplanina DSM 44594 TaxID=1284240 RepID=M2YRZ7_9PSEU|nr:antibiotic biosynthesis monooxygenase family protein [Amycolatopsis decaplanina]EME57637.1 antibiotic biosynthesis monooxygenase [Amycolatopsis decaplanina DSM 44594]